MGKPESWQAVQAVQETALYDRKLLSAAYIRELIFRNEAWYRRYLERLNGKVEEITKTVNPDGSVYVVLKQQYFHAPLWSGDGTDAAESGCR